MKGRREVKKTEWKEGKEGETEREWKRKRKRREGKERKGKEKKKRKEPKSGYLEPGFSFLRARYRRNRILQFISYVSKNFRCLSMDKENRNSQNFCHQVCEEMLGKQAIDFQLCSSILLCKKSCLAVFFKTNIYKMLRFRVGITSHKRVCSFFIPHTSKSFYLNLILIGYIVALISLGWCASPRLLHRSWNFLHTVIKSILKETQWEEINHGSPDDIVNWRINT